MNGEQNIVSGDNILMPCPPRPLFWRSCGLRRSMTVEISRHQSVWLLVIWAKERWSSLTGRMGLAWNRLGHPSHIPYVPRHNPSQLQEELAQTLHAGRTRSDVACGMNLKLGKLQSKARTTVTGHFLDPPATDTTWHPRRQSENQSNADWLGVQCPGAICHVTGRGVSIPRRGR